MVTLIMMIVITLIVLGFAEISRNEQRSSLDDQLSAQAYYAAESGVNDARTVIDAAVSAGNSVQDKTVCGNQGNYTLNSTVDATHNASYTCVLVDASPSTLVYNVGYTSTVVPIISSGGAFTSLILNWQVADGLSQSAAGCYTNIGSLDELPVASGGGAWGCNYPVVRIDMLDANGALARANWSGNTATMFLIPFNSVVVNNNVTLTSRGSVIPARCGATGCTANITGLAGTKYYLRITTLYQTNSKLTITAGAAGVQFTGAQATIDSTGKAQDVLRRVLVAVDLTDANASNIPSAAIISEDSICKRFGTTNASFNIYDNMTSGGGGDALCTPQSSGSPIP